ncbi:MAG: amino acid ABC transporter substrate-binding protein, partial [Proteobacteria bacterium]|nr:amino acid ABC transporter substrate-binding protein [Pseudomonadota bacterium]MBU1686013.1 amino acid ABC transporter substrate-binding protein [Pseudomonadota bacterium]
MKTLDTTRLAVLLILLVALGLIVKENLTQRPPRLEQLTDGRIDMCLSCHQSENPGPAHAPAIMGCAVCHLGNARAITKIEAHLDMVINPGDLRVVDQTCGIEGCHGVDGPKVKNSLMATNRGIIATMRYYWGETATQNGDFSVEQLLASGENSLALDYYRKLCATCHLWKQKNDLPDAPRFFNEKGGGCIACHSIPGKITNPSPTAKPHPLISKKIPVATCTRCHNRSGRVGTSYQGIYEAEGYGTPYENGGLSNKRLPGDRFYLELEDDIHHRQGMACIDCHTRNEIMGDGNRYAHYEEQLEIRCITCHSSNPGTTRKNQQLNNIVAEGDHFLLISKLDEKKHPLKQPKPESCNAKGHSRLSCESCHSSWAPQCYGCHVKLDRRETHLDKLTLTETPGWWEEGRSYLRYEQPMLAIWNNRVVIVTPGCQDIITVVNEQGEPEQQFNSLTMAALNPHTTQKGGRTCIDCHTSGKSIGLGEGTLRRENQEWHFTPLNRGIDTGAGLTPPLDGYVDLNGTPLQKSARPDLRPFNREELRRILRIGLCLQCHKTGNDPAYRTYTPGTLCPIFKEDLPDDQIQAEKKEKNEPIPHQN